MAAVTMAFLPRARRRGFPVTLSDDSLVKASGNQVSSEVDGEAVSVNLKSGVYYSLNAVGSRIWQLVQESSSVGDIRATIECHLPNSDRPRSPGLP